MDPILNIGELNCMNGCLSVCLTVHCLCSHPRLFDVPVLFFVEAHNSAGSVRSNSSLLSPGPAPSLTVPVDTPYGPFTLSQFIAIVIGGVVLMLEED